MPYTSPEPSSEHSIGAKKTHSPERLSRSPNTPRTLFFSPPKRNIGTTRRPTNVSTSDRTAHRTHRTPSISVPPHGDLLRDKNLRHRPYVYVLSLLGGGLLPWIRRPEYGCTTSQSSGPPEFTTQRYALRISDFIHSVCLQPGSICADYASISYH